MYPNGGHFPPTGQIPQGTMYPMMGGVPNMAPMQINPMQINPMQMNPMQPNQMRGPPQNIYMPGMVPPNNRMYIVPQGQPQMYAQPPVDPMVMRGPPPAYSTVTSKDYKVQQEKLQQQQQKQLEEQKKLLEQQAKQRHFQEQQQRLRQLSTMGCRKMDADSLIDSIVGRPKPKPVTRTVPTAIAPAALPTVTTEDDFGGFITGPTTTPTPPSQTTQNTNHQLPPAPQPVEKPAEPKKDLFNMMMQCSDLTAPKEAKGFARKPSCVKDVHVQKKRTESFTESQKSRRWEADTNALSDLFTLPGQGSQTFILPKWMTGDVAVPDVYNQVLEAVIPDGAIDTNLLYPILLRSGLTREVLGQIWQMCNKTTPGQLIREELFCILALISIAQNNMNYSSLEVLVKCPQAPIPNLGQDEMLIGQPEPSTVPTDAHPPPAVPAMPQRSGVVPMAIHIPGPTPPVNQNILPPPPPPEDDFADFADFQSAPPAAAAPTTPLSVSLPPPPVNDLIGQEDKYSAFKSVLTDPSADDEFGDFKSTDSRDSLSLASTEAALKSPRSQTDDSLTKGMSDSVSFSSFTSDSSNKIVSPPANLNTLEFADFKMAANTEAQSGDKYSALKALVMDKNLFEAPKEKEANSDWADFKANEESTQPEEEWASFSSAAPPTCTDFPVHQPSDFSALNDEDFPEPITKPVVKIDDSKANKLFGANMTPKQNPVGTGLSALDMLPPDFVEDDDDDPSGIDKFGTFQGGMMYGDEGISSIGAPYGGFDDLDVTPSVGKLTSMVKQDEGLFKPSKDNSPTDSQSVSSLDFVASTPGDPKTFVGQLDVQSVASLELKTVSSEVDLQLTAERAEDVTNGNRTEKQEEDFGDFNSASIEKKGPAKPLDMKEMLTEMPRLGDRYGSLMNEPQDSERHIFMWQQCLQQCAQMITQACTTINAIRNPSVIQEIISSDKGSEYLTAVTEIYKVACRIKQAMLCYSASNQKLSDLMLEIESSWGTLTVFIASTHVMPPASSLSFHKAALKADDDNTQNKACGVCLLNVDYVNNGSHDNGNHKLTYGGKQYHSPCANFWVNCVDSTLPALKIPELL